MTQFGNYSKYYDIFYRDKDYEGEARYVLDTLERHKPEATRILELGCGTGQHAALIAESGLFVHGIDISAAMLERAQSRLTKLPDKVRERVSFTQGDARKVRVDRRFDAVISLFHVMSYMADAGALEAAFRTAAAHLDNGGVFIFDCWYGPAVLSDQPEVRVRTYRDGQVVVTREATPEMLPNENLVKVHYRVRIEGLPGNTNEEVHETHTLRYLFLPEMRSLMVQSGLDYEAAYEYMTFSEPGMKSWNVLVVARRI